MYFSGISVNADDISYHRVDCLLWVSIIFNLSLEKV